MKLYKVTLWHEQSKKRVPYLITAGDHLHAIDKVLDWAHAPRSAVMTWEEATPKEARRLNKELGQ